MCASLSDLLLVPCVQIVDEGMLVYINDLLASGEIPDLFVQVSLAAVMGLDRRPACLSAALSTA